MINEVYCSFEVAELLEKNGFAEPSISCNEDLANYNGFEYSSRVSAPTQQMALAWLREKGIHVYVKPSIVTGRVGWIVRGYECYATTVHKTDSILYAWVNVIRLATDGHYADSYEEATEIGIKYILENLNQI